MMKRVAGQLRLDLAQYRELAEFARFGSDLDKATVAQLTRGEKMVEILKQDVLVPMPVEQQVMIIFIANKGFLDDIPTARLSQFESEFHAFMAKEYPDVVKTLATERALNEKIEQELTKAGERFKKQFLAKAAVASGAAAAAATHGEAKAGEKGAHASR
jgi:F-type H+-transporting ATPase subunit alpha